VIAQYLWIIGSSIFLLLGLAHLRITFFGKKLYPKNDATEISMKETHPRLTKDTTLWKTWIGFNASHSAGAIFFGVVNLILAIQYYEILTDSSSLLFLDIAFVLFFLFLAKLYWFKIPFIGILLALICFVCAILIDKL
jgi:hypothetical protein